MWSCHSSTLGAIFQLTSCAKKPRLHSPLSASQSAPAIVAGYGKRLKAGTHTKAAGTLGDLYLSVANDVLGAGIESFPTGRKANVALV